MELHLYNAAYSTCSQKVRLVMAEKSLSFVEHHIDLARKEQLAPEYLKLNPNGVVPTLTHGPAVITESSVIVEYLDEVFPEISLSPARPDARAHMRAWMRYLEEVPTAAVRVPSFNRVLRHRFEGMDEQTFQETQAEVRPIRKHLFRRMMGAKGFRAEDVQASMESLRQTAERLHHAVTKQGPWLLGEQITLADFVLAPLMDRMEDIGLGSVWEDLPGAAAWLAAIRARPSFAAAFYKGSRLSERHAMLPLVEA